MASTKVRTAFSIGPTLTAGAATVYSTSINLTDGYGGSLNVKITNGATGPTLPAQVQIEVSADDTTYYKFCGALVAGVTNAGVYSWGGIDIPTGIMYVRLAAGSNTGQNVTIVADIAEVTAIA